MASNGRQRGLLKLMLRFPLLRHELQAQYARDEDMAELCEAFDDASETLTRLTVDIDASPGLLEEYRSLCQDLEGDVVAYCMNISDRDE